MELGGTLVKIPISKNKFVKYLLLEITKSSRKIYFASAIKEKSINSWQTGSWPCFPGTWGDQVKAGKANSRIRNTQKRKKFIFSSFFLI